MMQLGNPRTVDELGRVVLPGTVRAMLGVSEEDKVVFVAGEDGRIYVQKAK